MPSPPGELRHGTTVEGGTRCREISLHILRRAEMNFGAQGLNICGPFWILTTGRVPAVAVCHQSGNPDFREAVNNPIFGH